MDDDKINDDVKRENNGRFQKGQTGNPKGNRHGCLSKEKRKVREMLNSALPEIIQKVVDQALGKGYETTKKMIIESQKMILDRAIPIKNANYLRLDSSMNIDYTKVGDIQRVSAWISGSLANGDMDKEQAESLRASLDQNVKLINDIQIPQRLDALEQAQGERKKNDSANVQ